MEGSTALAEAAVRAGCRFYAGYPITPSTEILEYMSTRLPEVGGTCMNAESEIEAIGMVWGAAGCGVRAMIASTGQGISLMQESFAELANAQIPMVAVNMCRGQGDYFQATRGGGQGDFLLAHTSELVEFRPLDEPPLPPKTWATTGADGRRGLTLSPLGPSEKLSTDLAAALGKVTEKHPAIKAAEVRVDSGWVDDADLVVIAF